MVCGRLEDLLSRPNVLAELKSDPGPLGLDTLLAEIGKLSTVRALGLTEAVFGDASDRIVAAWRARAARMYASDFADCPEPVRYALLAALCWTRQAELVDGLVELLIGLIHRINARAERRVEKELIGELANVPGKRGIFTRMVDAALEHPDDTVREAAVPGGAGRGEDAERAGQGAEGDRAGGGRAGPLPAARLLLALLPADARPAAGRAGVPLQQQRLPAGDGRHRPARPLRGRRQRPEALRGRGEGVPVAIAENPTNPPLTCGDVVLFGLVSGRGGGRPGRLRR